MGETNTYIKLFRSIEQWEWFKDANTFRVWIYLLLHANVSDFRFKGIDVKRGQLATSYDSISEALGISYSKTRTAIEHLKSTGEIAVKIYPKFQLIELNNYDLYQTKSQAKTQASRTQIAGKSQQYKNERMKEEKNNSVFVKPTIQEVADYCRERGNGIDPEKFVAYYETRGWKAGKVSMKSWKNAIITWEKNDPDKAPKQEHKESRYDG